MMEQWTLYYDGGCNLCHTSQLKLEKWAARAGQPLRVDVLQSDAGIAKGYGLDGLVLEIDGQPHIGYDGWFESMKVAPWYLRWVYSLRNNKLARRFAKYWYGVVAKYRYKWFGTRACQIPAPKS
jgi:predicted DCC family thiol-disulfide oxidoreductase YuxK